MNTLYFGETLEGTGQTEAVPNKASQQFAAVLNNKELRR